MLWTVYDVIDGHKDATHSFGQVSMLYSLKHSCTEWQRAEFQTAVWTGILHARTALVFISLHDLIDV